MEFHCISTVSALEKLSTHIIKFSVKNFVGFYRSDFLVEVQGVSTTKQYREEMREK